MTLAALALSLSFVLAPPANPVDFTAAGAGSGDGFHVSRFDGLAAWSRRTPAGYRLVLRSGRARPRLAPVEPSPFPFDVDVGSDERGRPAVVYPRCFASWPENRDLPIRAGCDLHRLDPRTGAEEPIARLNTPAEELRPAIHRGRVAYARLPGGPGLEVLVEGRPVARRTFDATVVPEDVLGLDHGRPGVAFSVRDHEGRSNLMFLVRPGRRAEVVGGGGIGEENNRVVRAPTFAGRKLYWAYANQHSAADPELRGWVVRYDLRTVEVDGARAPHHLISVAADAARPGAPLLGVSDPSDAYARYVFGRQRMHVLRPRFGPVAPGVG